jgi:putative hydrolase of the HAD superfamily
MFPSDQNRVVIFDLGNVLLHWDVNNVLDSLELEAEEKNLLRKELFAHQAWLDMDHGKKTEATVVAEICNRSPLSGRTVEAALSAARMSLLPIAESVALMQDVSANDIEMYCLSNMSRENYSHIKRMDFFDLFSGVVISGIEECMKPDEKIFQLIIDRFDLSPADTLFIDDSLANIQAAQRLGIDGFHFKGSRSCYSEIRKLLF